MNLRINKEKEKEKKPDTMSIICLLTEDEVKNFILSVSSVIESSVEIAGFFQQTTRANIADIRNAFIKIRLNNEESTYIFVGRVLQERNDL
ncbi:hypothetical protein AVEN_176813-1 [Araneus ventricosus]|uniref:Uncharacterized protein n=1 Tax=Araneus ventricosus TaxID=182803 RepID=A0A4Y2MT38_ARAVE|nr:hypothetical protein AVEN_176813-1 [Araneus ventricosus]